MPRRITKSSLSRKDYQGIGDSFPGLLDALEEHASDRLAGIDLGEIEWFHRLRNQLYHQGSGLTVDREKGEVYAEIAKLLFQNLFGEALLETPSNSQARVGRFLAAWVVVDGRLQSYLAARSPARWSLSFPLGAARDVPPILQCPESRSELNRLRDVRNSVVHSGQQPTEEDIRLIEDWARRLQQAE